MRLINQDPSDRYRADEAMNHPWITRKKNFVPQTISEKRKTFINQITFVNVVHQFIYFFEAYYIFIDYFSLFSVVFNIEENERFAENFSKLSQSSNKIKFYLKLI